jgi:transposase
MKTISETIGGAQALLDIGFDLQNCFEEQLTETNKTFLHMIRVLEEVQQPLERPYAGIGRKPYSYTPFMRSMWAKSFFGIPKTRELINRLQTDPNLRLLCGFETVPGKATFSRAFAYLAKATIADKTLDSLVTSTHKGLVVYHVNRDSTAIEARGKKPEKKVKPPAMKGRGPEKGENRPKPVQPKQGEVLNRQGAEPLEVSLQAVPKAYSCGCKRNSKGNASFWYGYKLHLDVSDCGFPLSAVVSGANVADCQVAIILEKMTEQKVSFCYSLMDSAYDAMAIRNFIESRGRVPIIEPHPRYRSRLPLDPAQQERYKMRTYVERAFSYLKENLIPKKIYVKGDQKVSFVLMTAVLCLAALRTLQYFIL